MPSSIADHIVPLPADPHAGDWSLENGQGTCVDCHNWKIAQEKQDPAFGHKLRQEGAATGEPAPRGWRHAA